jgi:hypothetical protein
LDDGYAKGRVEAERSLPEVNACELKIQAGRALIVREGLNARQQTRGLLCNVVEQGFNQGEVSMKTGLLLSYLAVMSLLLPSNRAASQLMSKYVENSPERRGELGCSIIETKSLPAGLKGPLFWHIDRFDSAEHAHAAVGPCGDCSVLPQCAVIPVNTKIDRRLASSVDVNRERALLSGIRPI